MTVLKWSQDNSVELKKFSRRTGNLRKIFTNKQYWYAKKTKQNKKRYSKLRQQNEKMKKAICGGRKSQFEQYEAQFGWSSGHVRRALGDKILKVDGTVFKEAIDCQTVFCDLLGNRNPLMLFKSSF